MLLVLSAVAGLSTDALRGSSPQQVGTWAGLGTVADGRSGAAAVALSDGRTLIAGGQAADGTATDSVVIFDPVTRSETQVGRLLERRVDHSATLLHDGRVLIAGGVVNGLISADIELFDPAAGTSVLAGSMSLARARHAGALVANGTVMIAGGVSVDGIVLDEVEMVDPSTGGSTPLSSRMTTPRAGASATPLIEGHILIAGGQNSGGDLDTAELFEPWSDSFIPTDTRLSVARSGHSAVLLPHNAGVLIAGGTSAGAAVAASDLFLPAIFPDPFTFGMGAFAPTASLGSARHDGIAGPVGDDGYAFVAGGGTTQAEQYRYATVKTDKDDYAPGERAVITGSGWVSGETVTLRFQEDPAVHTDYVLTVTADAEGNIYWDQWSPEQHDLNVRFYLMASDSRSRAQMTFTDSQPASITANPAAVSVLPGNTATYNLAVVLNGNGNNCTVSLSISTTTLLPPGALPSFTNSPITTDAGYSSVLTIATTDTGAPTGRTPSGTYSFQVKTTKAANCQGGAGAGPSVTATLTVLDATAPGTASVTVPLNASAFTAANVPSAFSGSAADNFNGVGLAASSTTLTLQQPDGTYWNGAAWQAAVFNLSTTHSATTSDAIAAWTRSTGMPSWASQPLGTYTVRATATDRSGNTFSGAAVTFALQSAGPTELAFTTAPLTGTVGQCLGAIAIQTQNASSVATNVTSNTTVSLSTNAGTGGGFFSDSTCTTPVTSVSIVNGSNVASVFYKATSRGTGAHLLSASATGLTSASQTEMINKADQTIAFDALGAKTFGDADFSVSATASSGLTVSFTASGQCTVTGATIHLTGGGSCTITASQSGNGDFNAAPDVPRPFSIAKASSTTTVTVANATFDGSPHGGSASVTGFDGLNQSVTVNYVGRNATAYPSSMTAPTNAGEYTISASFAGDPNHEPSSDSREFSIARADQTIAFGALVERTFGDPDFGVSATSSSGLTVSFAAIGGCTVTASTVHITAAGACTINASQLGNGNYNPATDVPQSFTIARASSTTTVSIADATYDGSSHGGTATATGAGGLDQPLTVHYVGRLGTAYPYSTTAPTNAGDYTASASFAGDANHDPSNDSKDFSIAKANQTIAFGTLADRTFGDPDFNVSATSSSGLTVSVAASGVCTVTGSTVHITAAGSCTITASQSGDGNFNPAADAPRSFAIAKAPSTTIVTVASASYDGSPHGGAANVTGFGGLSLSLPVSYAGRNGTLYPSSTSAPTNAGDYTASASFAGDADHNPSSDVKYYSIAKANQTIAFGPLATRLFGDPDFAVTATASSGLGVAFAATGQCMVSGSIVHLTAAGSCTVTASQAGDGNYNPAANVPQTFTITAWTLSGFYQPVDPSTPSGIIWNTVKAGSTVPLKFNIFAASTEQTTVSAVQSMSAFVVSCYLSAASLESLITDLSTAGGASLRYDTTAHQFIQNWQTPKSAGVCYQIVMTAADGSKINNAFFKTK
jgi:hypothetical protein